MTCHLSSRWCLSSTSLPQVKSLFNFLLGISIEWDLDDINLAESGAICRNYLNKYYKSVKDEQITANWIFIGCLPLWGERHSLCPIIHDFNLKALGDADDASVCLMLPQLVRAIISTRDTLSFESVVQRTIGDSCSTGHLFWLLMTELDLGTQDKRFLTIAVYKLLTTTSFRRSLKLQGGLIEKLVKLANTLAAERCSFAEKKQLFKKLLLCSSFGLDLFEPVRWPLNTSLSITTIVVDECTLFHSQLCPMLLTFMTTCGKRVKCIFKLGDDLRQDALVMQMTKSIRRVLGEILPISCDNIVHYHVLSTGSNHGLVEYVPSRCLEDLLPTVKGNCNWLPHEQIDRFIESCAFYSVWSYILCVGDRHLDNILVTEDGRFFHIDYSFLGREPKPFAPNIKLCPDILFLFGGRDSDNYRRFLTLCVKVFHVLQSTSLLWLQQFSMSMDVGIMDINRGVLEKIQQRLLVDEINLVAEINKAFDSRLPQVMDNFHRTWKVINGGRVTDTVDEEWCDVDASMCGSDA